MDSLVGLAGLSRSNQINQLTMGWGQIAIDRVGEGWLPYLLVLKFHHMAGRPDTVLAQMQREAERVYASVLTRVWRRPHTATNRARLPVWILVPDFPVPKRAKERLRDLTPNGGLHLQGVAVVPPGSRLVEGLDGHLADDRRYCGAGSPLASVFAKRITSNLDYVHGYNFKALARGRADFDAVLILPRTSSELRSVPRLAAEPWRRPVLDRG
ncbi:hypothetical protein [Methylobacterium crusticola]|nr:hypothetical protein [Methylobacterium crusticola]